MKIWERRVFCTLFLTGLGLALGQAENSHAQPSRPVVHAEISHIGDTAHLEFKGLKTWRYEMHKTNAKKVQLSIAPIDEASVARLRAFSDPLIPAIEINEKGPDNTFILTFELGQQNVESFDYLTDEPSRLIIDFYRKSEPEVKKQQVATVEKAPTDKGKAQTARNNQAIGAPSPVAQVPNEEGYEKVPQPQRTPAGDEVLSVDGPTTLTPAPEVEGKAKPNDLRSRFGIFDAGDENYDRFRIKDYEIREEAIISSRQNIYLPFPPLKMKVSQLDKLIEQQPEYVIRPKDTRENKEARLLLTLAERKRWAVYLKTYDYFVNKYPESPYIEILKNVTARVHLIRWKKSGKSEDFEDARSLYSELVQKFADSPLRQYNNLTLGFALMEHGDALVTLQIFEGFLHNFPSSPDIPQVRKALAEAYLILRKYDEATAEYNNIIKDFPKTDHAREARYRLGDVHFERGDYTQAILAYEEAIKELPGQEKVYPNANFNMAEARFWQKDFKKSLGDYIRFVNLFPTHHYGGYALARIGELLGIMGADQRRVMGAFLESYFRYPTHPGAKVARIRMLSQQMKGMKAKELKRVLEEINETAIKLNLPGIKEFTTLMVAEGLSHRGQYKEAIENLISYYQKNPTASNLDSFKIRILRNIANELKEEVDDGEFMRALVFYSQYSGTWLNNSERIDVPFFVAAAYERAGDYSEAQKIYSEALKRRLQIVGTEVEKEKKVQEHLPSVASLHLRLASTLAQDRDYMNAYQQLKNVTNNEELTPAEVVEGVELSALIAEQRNDHQRAREALTELAQKWKGDPALVAPVNLKLAKTYLKLGDHKKAESHADRVLEAESGETKPPDNVIMDAMIAKADALLGQKRALAAVEVYQKMMDRFESKKSLANVRYKVGQILFDNGDLKGAEEVWKRLAGTPNELLWKIGKEKLDQTQWQGDYTKYMNRIPAMAGRKPKESKP